MNKIDQAQRMHALITRAKDSVSDVITEAKECGRWEVVPDFVQIKKELEAKERVFSMLVKEEQSNAVETE